MENHSDKEQATLENTSHPINESHLKTLSNLVQLYREYHKDIEDLEQQLEDVRSQYNKLKEFTIPEYMGELGFQDGTVLELADGLTLTIKPITVASITQARRDQAHVWLIDNGFKDIIKHEFKINFGKDDSERANLFKNVLEGEELLKEAKWSDKETVHPGILKAMVKEQIDKGNDLFLEADVMELLGIKVLKQAVIK